jgi:hypothetical protein
MRLKKRLPAPFRMLAAIAVAVLLLPQRTLSVPHRLVPLPADVHVAASGRGMTHPLYLIAPVIDGELDEPKKEKATIDLENKIHLKPGLGQDRVEEAPDSFNKITRCPSYPCEVVAENVTREENSYDYQLQFRIIRQPNDKSPIPAHHPSSTDAWECPLSGDTNVNDCRRRALEEMARKLQTHDSAYHSREQ